MAYARGYRAFGYDTATVGWNARKAFSLFAGFDYAVFGHKQFRLKDHRLFGSPSDTIERVATLKSIGGQNISARANDILMDCYSWTICEPVPSDGPYNRGRRLLAS